MIVGYMFIFSVLTRMCFVRMHTEKQPAIHKLIISRFHCDALSLLNRGIIINKGNQCNLYKSYCYMRFSTLFNNGFFNLIIFCTNKVYF